MDRVRSHCVSKSWRLLKRLINKKVPTAAAMMSIAMRAKVIIPLVRGFIIRSVPIGIKSVNSHK